MTSTDREAQLLAALRQLGEADRAALPEGGVADAVMLAVSGAPDLAPAVTLVARAPVARPRANRHWLTRPILPLWAVALLVAVAGVLVAWLASRAPALSSPSLASPSLSSPVRVASAVPVRHVAARPCRAERVIVYRFVLRAPSAHDVALVGDFNAWKARATLLRDDGDGTWSVTVPLKPGRYRYKFLVDGRWVLDPNASASASDGFGGRNAVISL